MLRSECDIRWIEYGMSEMKKLTTERTGGGSRKEQVSRRTPLPLLHEWHVAGEVGQDVEMIERVS